MEIWIILSKDTSFVWNGSAFKSLEEAHKEYNKIHNKGLYSIRKLVVKENVTE